MWYSDRRKRTRSTHYPDLVPERAALYRRYRPQTFSAIVGQDHVTRTLRNAIAGGQVAHAYLLAGARGIGKTSIARIIAKAVNCPKAKDGDPCDRCESCVAIRDGRFLDLIEIDAASNRGIDEMRDLAGALTLAGDEGAKIRSSLSARAESMRRAELADAEGKAGENSQSMLIAQLLICSAFLIFLAYPATYNILRS